MCMVYRIDVRLYKMMYTFPSKMSSPDTTFDLSTPFIKKIWIKKRICHVKVFFLYESQNCLKNSKTDLNDISVWRLVVCFPTINVLSWTKRYVFIMGHILECRYLCKFLRSSLEIFELLISGDILFQLCHKTHNSEDVNFLLSVRHSWGTWLWKGPYTYIFSGGIYIGCSLEPLF